MTNPGTIVESPPVPDRPMIWRAILAETSHRLGGRALGGLLALVTLRLVVDDFGPSQWGQVSAAVAWVGMFATIGEFGISTAATRDLASSKESGARVLAGTYVVGLAGSALAAAAAWTIGEVFYGNRPTILHLVAISLPIFPFTVLWMIAGSLLAANRRSDLRGLLDVLSSLLILIAALIVVRGHFGAAWYVIGAVLSTAITSTLAIVLLRWTDLPRPSYVELRSSTVERLRATRLIGLATVVGLIYWYVDTVLLSLLSTNAQVGAYAIAYQLAGFAMSIPTFLLGACVSRYVAANSAERSDLVRRVVNLFVASGAFGAALLIAFAAIAIHLVGGYRADGAIIPFEFLVASAALMWLATAYSTFLVWEGAERISAQVMAGALLLDVGLNFALDRTFGAAGAAFAMIVSQGFAAGVCGVAYYRSTGVRPSSFSIFGAIGGVGLVGSTLLLARPL